MFLGGGAAQKHIKSLAMVFGEIESGGVVNITAL
jgi:hypothetical protein